jgi:hypothetical protein
MGLLTRISEFGTRSRELCESANLSQTIQPELGQAMLYDSRVTFGNSFSGLANLVKTGSLRKYSGLRYSG